MCSVMGSDQQQFCLRWHNFQNNLLTSLPQFLNGDDLTDVTLSAGGRSIRAHRVVLSASSQYFKEIFKELQPMQHPVIVLPGMNFKDLCALLTFMYSGEVNIYQDQLPGLLSMADTLHVRGLAEVQGGDNKPLTEVTANKNISNTTAKRPKTISSPSQNHGMVIHTSTNEDNRFKTANLQCENKSFKDLNENNTNKFDVYRPFYGLPFDDSTLKMMSNNSKVVKGCGRLKQKKPGLGSTLPPGPFTPNSSVAVGLGVADIYASLPPFKSDSFRFNDDPMEAQDLSKVRGGGGENDVQEQEVHSAPDFIMDPDGNAVSGSYYDIKSETHSPESDDSGGLLGDPMRDLGSAFGKGFAGNQSKGYATCPVCKKQLSNQYNLRVHLETHQNVQYSCSVCSHVSRSRDALRKHVSYRHPVEGKEVGKKGKSEGGKRSRGEEMCLDGIEQQESPCSVPLPLPLPLPHPPPQPSPSPLSLAQLSVVSP